MKKKGSFFAVLLLIISIFLIPLGAHADDPEKDFGNIAGESDYDYDSIWEVETPTTAPQYSGSTEEDSSGCMGCDGCFGIEQGVHTSCVSRGACRYRYRYNHYEYR
ncbi:MAG: hypothetical protein IKH78_05085 [Ruminococcus sp.]|nr:hypothetical protein [Ruminococcus sp.]